MTIGVDQLDSLVSGNGTAVSGGDTLDCAGGHGLTLLGRGVLSLSKGDELTGFGALNESRRVGYQQRKGTLKGKGMVLWLYICRRGRYADL